MKVIKAPGKIDWELSDLTVFLAGSIEMGKAVDWQTQLTNSLSQLDVTVLNPRRDDWDSSWKQDIKNPQFNEQVTWELDALEGADLIVMYFDPSTMSPISLLELGLNAYKAMIVCCPAGFWRKGNVDIVCKRYGINVVETLEELTEYVKNYVSFCNNMEENL
jgi:hypothetical protein